MGFFINKGGRPAKGAQTPPLTSPAKKMGVFIDKGGRPAMGAQTSRFASPAKKIKAEHAHRDSKNGAKEAQKHANGKDWRKK